MNDPAPGDADFPGRIGHTLAGSTPWWPERSGHRPGTPNLLIVLFDAETDQYGPERVQDDTLITAPGTFETGYHLRADPIDQALSMLAGHHADRPQSPWFTRPALDACHAPHQAPADLIRSDDAQFVHGRDQQRQRRLDRQIALGLVPPGTELPPRNAGVPVRGDVPPEQQRLFTRLPSAYAAMLDQADPQFPKSDRLLEAAVGRFSPLDRPHGFWLLGPRPPSPPG